MLPKEQVLYAVALPTNGIYFLVAHVHLLDQDLSELAIGDFNVVTPFEDILKLFNTS